MRFLWPELLWLLLLLPLLALAYLDMLRRKKKAAIRYASLRLIREALGRGPDRPAGYEDLEQRPQRFDLMDADVEAVKACIAARCGG